MVTTQGFYGENFLKDNKNLQMMRNEFNDLKVVDKKKVYKTSIVCSSNQKHHFIHEKIRRSFESKIPRINLLTCKYIERKSF